MNCAELIYQILTILDSDFESANEFVQADKKCVEELMNLDDSCAEELRKITKDFLKHISQEEDYEYKFQILLRALAGRNDDETSIILRAALLDPKAEDKETYINFVEQLNAPESIYWIAEFLSSARAAENHEEAVEQAIDFLRIHQARNFGKQIIPELQDKASRVRMAALHFVSELGLREAEDILIKQFMHEDTPENLRLIVQTLKTWKTPDLLAILQRRLKAETLKIDSQLEEVITAEINSVNQ